ncbi:MAG: MBL fold metallo-hydrolase, partial [Planctomycetota bacterium]
LRVETIRTPHDAADGVAFVVDDGCRRLGILTDLGHPFPELDGVLESLDAVLLESNYDPRLLETGDYPAFLKDRIRGRHGHLSNDECAQLVRRYGKRLRWVCLGHLSDENNTPQHAERTFRRHVGEKLPFDVAPHYEPGRLLRVE